MCGMGESLERRAAGEQSDQAIQQLKERGEEVPDRRSDIRKEQSDEKQEKKQLQDAFQHGFGLRE